MNRWIETHPRSAAFVVAMLGLVLLQGCALNWYREPGSTPPDPCTRAKAEQEQACKDPESPACVEAAAQATVACLSPTDNPDVKGQEEDGKPAPAPDPPPGPTVPPALTCANLDCDEDKGYRCEESSSGPRCVQVEPAHEPRCSDSLSRDCWHMTAPSNTWQYRCADGTTDAAAPSGCPAVPPAPAPGCSLDGVVDPQTIVGVEPKPQAPAKLGDDVNAVLAELTGCQPQSGDCAVGPYDPWVARVAAGLRARGWCVGLHVHPDALAVAAPGDISISYAVHVHVSAPADRARWWPSAYVDAWRAPAPPAGPPGEDLAPLPDRRALWIRAHWTNGILDGTPEVKPKDGAEPADVHALCVAYGFGFWADGRERFNCALGPDLTPQRLGRERWALGGDSVCQAQPAGAQAWPLEDNWLQCAVAEGATAARICSADLSLCSDWVAP